MAKQGMRRYQPVNDKNPKRPSHKNDAPPVPELQGKAKTGKEKAKPR